MALRFTTEKEKQIFNWLHDKRDANRINMDTIHKEMMTEFGLNRATSELEFEVWINNSNDAGNYEDIII